jgi:GrpB-like predicted nucleotidyltransferase (UPF0157 family)
VLPRADVEHVGSTSVLGFGGRGVIDAVLFSKPPDHAVILTALQQVGFAEFPYGPARPEASADDNAPARKPRLRRARVPASADARGASPAPAHTSQRSRSPRTCTSTLIANRTSTTSPTGVDVQAHQ